ncbi:DUF4258 domain-containing protein [Maribacter algarum]|uniref:DUF4258 domain-containing protein n=1 Tax=Maribacter algarum (ex Zhang et al. 2020) TaxID=2578118 RepID=A0A5S3PRQ9_9FLAO|nr:DUF4258 domain-containing protein [Maribacter algarum]TMM57446.1 DUF4258 domain-containing protein [Maribacter algarum]
MFIKRLGYFMVGLSIGIVFLTFFLKKKSDETGVSFCYFPNCRVLKDLRSKPIAYSDRISEMLKNQELDTLVINTFFTEGEINFSSSDTKSKPCKTYLIEGEIDLELVTMEVKNCPNKVTVIGLR